MTEKVIDLGQVRAGRQLAIDASLRTTADEDVLCRITIYRSARVNVWMASVFETEPQKDWLISQLDVAVDTTLELLNQPQDPRPDPPGPRAA
jgi:hypothetical protein